MSNDPSHEPTPDVEPESLSIEDRQTLESNGRRAGDLWVRDRAGSIELERTSNAPVGRLRIFGSAATAIRQF